MLNQFEPKHYEDNKIETSIQAEEKKEIKFIGSVRKIPGHVMWSYNYKTSQLMIAKYKKQETLELKTLSLEDPSLQQLKRIIATEDDCFYFQALNRKNAIKHMRKRGFKNFTE